MTSVTSTSTPTPTRRGLTTSALTADGPWFKDDAGRVVLLRGVNLSGCAKLPTAPHVTSYTRDDALFFDHKNVSFVGRPLPLESANEHLSRLKSWGFLFLRFLVTWEALEHTGPGQYDEDYIDYVAKVLEVAKRLGFLVFIDPHQDVWSRFTGGSGAPGWTLEAAGLDMRHLKENNAAIVQNTWGNDNTEPHGFPRMIWPSNYNKYACYTMFTLFFGGKTFAPGMMVGDENIQDYLQGHYIRAIQYLAKRVQHLGIAVGYDTLNEPSHGLIGCSDLNAYPHSQIMRYQLTPTPFQAMKLASGVPTLVDWYERTWYGFGSMGSQLVNAERVSAFLPGRICPWLEHGVWKQPGELLKPTYFSIKPDGSKYDFINEFWMPFVSRYTQAIREVHPQAIMFVDPPVMEVPPKFDAPIFTPEKDSAALPAIQGPLVYAPHWYDGVTLFQKAYSFWNVNVLALKRGRSIFSSLHLGSASIRSSFVDQIRQIRTEGLDNVGQYPCLLGETGIPFDMHEREAYRTNCYAKQIEAMDATLAAMDANLVNYTIWNYNHENTNVFGDHWNGEDFSVFSKDAPSMETNAQVPLASDANPSEAGLAENTNAAPQPATTSSVAVPNSIGSSTGITALLASVGLRNPFNASQGFLHFEKDLDRGGRALPAVIRPYPLKTAGEPTSLSFDITTKVFKYQFRNTQWLPTDETATEIFLPHYHFGTSSTNFIVQVSDGLYSYHPDEQLLVYKHASLNVAVHSIVVMRVTPV